MGCLSVCEKFRSKAAKMYLHHHGSTEPPFDETWHASDSLPGWKTCRQQVRCEPKEQSKCRHASYILEHFLQVKILPKTINMGWDAVTPSTLL
jgi:hypothetical protein